MKLYFWVSRTCGTRGVFGVPQAAPERKSTVDAIIGPKIS